MSKIGALMVSLVAFLMLSPRMASAVATGQLCDVKTIGWNNDPVGTGRELYLSCSQDTAHSYVAWPAGVSGPCSGSGVDIDTIKLWQSIAVSGKLAGRTVQVWYNSCTAGARIIAAIDF
jgi:hypothetical protein